MHRYRCRKVAMNKKLFAGLVVLGALAVPLAGLASAGSGGSSGTVKAVTHASNHPDTCACVTSVLSPNGYVWAYDNLSRQLVATDNGNGTYTVVVTDNGSFSAFSEPNNADLTTNHPITANGSIDGTITYIVTGGTPDPSLLPSQVPSDQGTGATVLEMFTPGASFVPSTTPYTYVYRAGGQTYTQTTNSITGDITGH
jgi:hypothetical protein